MTEPKPSPTMEWGRFEQWLEAGDFEALRDFVQTLISENAELKRRPTNGRIEAALRQAFVDGWEACNEDIAGDEAKKVETLTAGRLLSQLYPAESEKE